MYDSFRSCCVKWIILACMSMSFLFGFRCVYFMSSRVHARVIFLSFFSRRYSRLGSPGVWDSSAGCLHILSTNSCSLSTDKINKLVLSTDSINLSAKSCFVA